MTTVCLVWDVLRCETGCVVRTLACSKLAQLAAGAPSCVRGFDLHPCLFFFFPRLDSRPDEFQCFAANILKSWALINTEASQRAETADGVSTATLSSLFTLLCQDN